LVERANDGTFTPSYAVSYREKHRREAIERARPFEQRKQGSASAPVHAAKTADRVMSALRAKRKSSESL
jgi:hypothetical protein